MRSIIKRKEFEESKPPKKEDFDPFSIPSTEELREQEAKKMEEEVGEHLFPNLDDVYTSDDPIE